MSESKDNIKAVVWAVTLIPPLIEGLFGAIRAIKDGFLRLKGEKTSVQIAIEKHVKMCEDEVVKRIEDQVKERIEYLEKRELEEMKLHEKIVQGEK